MKHLSFSTAIVFTLVVTTLLPACQKNGGGGGQNTGGDVMYPATLSFYEGNQSGYPAVSAFKYDDKHHLTYLGYKDRNLTISGNQVLQTVITSIDTVYVVNIFSGDIYTGNGVSLVKTNYVNKSASGSTTSPVNTYYFTVGGAPNYTLGNNNAGTYTHFFTYDDKGNLSSSRIVTNAVGSPNSTNYDPGGLEYDRLTYKGYDNKPSPYSAVPGYRFISYLWSYPQQFAFALSKNNPTQIIEESLNTTTMKWSVYRQVDYTYAYNDQGYPSQVQIKTVYPSTGTPNQAFYETYNFTYTK